MPFGSGPWSSKVQSSIVTCCVGGSLTFGWYEQCWKYCCICACAVVVNSGFVVHDASLGEWFQTFCRTIVPCILKCQAVHEEWHLFAPLYPWKERHRVPSEHQEPLTCCHSITIPKDQNSPTHLCLMSILYDHLHFRVYRLENWV
jgi:hypothetical protein